MHLSMHLYMFVNTCIYSTTEGEAHGGKWEGGSPCKSITLHTHVYMRVHVLWACAICMYYIHMLCACVVCIFHVHMLRACAMCICFVHVLWDWAWVYAMGMAAGMRYGHGHGHGHGHSYGHCLDQGHGHGHHSWGHCTRTFMCLRFSPGKILST